MRVVCVLTLGIASIALLFVATNVAHAAGRESERQPQAQLSADSSQGTIGLRLLDAPVSAGDDPRAQIYVVDHLAPGSSIHRRLEVSNTTSNTAHVSLYSAAATIKGGSFIGAAGHTRNEVSTWTDVGPQEVDVAAGGVGVVTMSITVPDDAAPGERYGVVWAEVRSASTTENGVTEVNRVGIRIYLSIGPGGAPAAAFTIDSLTAQRSDDGAPVVLATVHNTGGRALDMYGTLMLDDGPGGLSAGPFDVTLGTTLGIGDTEPVMVVLDDQVPAGPWDATVRLRSGLLSETAHATITFPKTGSAAATPTTSAGGLRWILMALAGIVLLALLVVLLMLWMRRHPRLHSGLAVRRTRPTSP